MLVSSLSSIYLSMLHITRLSMFLFDSHDFSSFVLREFFNSSSIVGIDFFSPLPFIFAIAYRSQSLFQYIKLYLGYFVDPHHLFVCSTFSVSRLFAFLLSTKYTHLR